MILFLETLLVGFVSGVCSSALIVAATHMGGAIGAIMVAMVPPVMLFGIFGVMVIMREN